MNMKRVFFINGVNGPKRNGNQSLKNTILGYLRKGWSVYVFDLLSNHDLRYDFSTLKKNGSFRHIGIPHAIWMFTDTVLRKIKRRMSGKKRTNQTLNMPSSIRAIVDPGKSEVNSKQIFIAKLYTLFEIFRTGLFFILLKPDVTYGYEIYGARVASFWRSIGMSGKTILRFMGTYITKHNRQEKSIQYHLRCMSGACDGIVMTNDGTKGNDVLRSLAIPEKKIMFAINGIDDSIKKPDVDTVKKIRKIINPKGRQLVFGIFNRFYPWKRIDRAIRLHRKMLNDGLDVQLVIAGHGGPLHESLMRLVDEIGSGENVTWLSSIPHSVMMAYYSACDISLVLNDYANLGNQVLESLYLGVPLLATDDGENSKMFGDCPYARFVSPEKLESIEVEYILELAKAKTQYINSALEAWSSRINREIEWIQSL